MILTRENINPLWTTRRDGKPVRIFQPRPEIVGCPDVQILSVLMHDAYTRIDFHFRDNKSNIKRPRLSIAAKIKLMIAADRETYTRETSYELIKDENAPIFPKEYQSKAEDDELFFTLFFEPMPMYALEFDIVEEEDDEELSGMMNYYSIDLSKGTRRWEIKNSDN